MGEMIATAPCRFCGQMNQVEEGLTKPQAEEQATMTCMCEEALEYQQKKARKDNAKNNVQALFGKDAATQKKCDEKVVNLLNDGVEMIYSGEIAKMTLNLPGGTKATISRNSKGEISVERMETKKQKLTEKEE